MNKKIGYQMFLNADPAFNDATIEKFLQEDPGRKKIEIRRYCNFSAQPIENPKLQGIKIPVGMMQVQTSFLFGDLLIFERSEKDLAKLNQLAES